MPEGQCSALHRCTTASKQDSLAKNANECTSYSCPRDRDENGGSSAGTRTSSRLSLGALLAIEFSYDGIGLPSVTRTAAFAASPRAEEASRRSDLLYIATQRSKSRLLAGHAKESTFSSFHHGLQIEDRAEVKTLALLHLTSWRFAPTILSPR